MKCKADNCGKEIIFTMTKNGKHMPTDVSSLTEEDIHWLLNRRDNEMLLFRFGEHISHYATCTNPEQFRRKMYGGFNKQKQSNKRDADSTE